MQVLETHVRSKTDAPERFVERIPVAASARRLVLVTDGYPFVRGTLAETEAELAELMARDPLGITEWPRPRALGGGLVAFDDRAWLELDIAPAAERGHGP